jgi:S1-C subfamily serine protease
MVAETVERSTDASTTVATTASPMPATVIARVERSVLPGSCASGNPGDNFTGTGFVVAGGVATASHVVAACPAGAKILFGWGVHDASSGIVSTDDRAHDLALVTYHVFGSSLPALRLESAPAYVGEPLALIGVPGLSGFSPFQTRAEVVCGNVVATNHTQHLTSAEGVGETLTGAIEVAAPGVVLGESGGPAIDAGGNVVGVIEGRAAGIVTLTPVSDMASLQ